MNSTTSIQPTNKKVTSWCPDMTDFCVNCMFLQWNLCDYDVESSCLQYQQHPSSTTLTNWKPNNKPILYVASLKLNLLLRSTAFILIALFSIRHMYWYITDPLLLWNKANTKATVLWIWHSPKRLSQIPSIQLGRSTTVLIIGNSSTHAWWSF